MITKEEIDHLNVHINEVEQDIEAIIQHIDHAVIKIVRWLDGPKEFQQSVKRLIENTSHSSEYLENLSRTITNIKWVQTDEGFEKRFVSMRETLILPLKEFCDREMVKLQAKAISLTENYLRSTVLRERLEFVERHHNEQSDKPITAERNEIQSEQKLILQSIVNLYVSCEDQLNHILEHRDYIIGIYFSEIMRFYSSYVHKCDVETQQTLQNDFFQQINTVISNLPSTIVRKQSIGARSLKSTTASAIAPVTMDRKQISQEIKPKTNEDEAVARPYSFSEGTNIKSAVNNNLFGDGQRFVDQRNHSTTIDLKSSLTSHNSKSSINTFENSVEAEKMMNDLLEEDAKIREKAIASESTTTPQSETIHFNTNTPITSNETEPKLLKSHRLSHSTNDIFADSRMNPVRKVNSAIGTMGANKELENEMHASKEIRENGIPINNDSNTFNQTMSSLPENKTLPTVESTRTRPLDTANQPSIRSIGLHSTHINDSFVPSEMQSQTNTEDLSNDSKQLRHTTAATTSNPNTRDSPIVFQKKSFNEHTTQVHHPGHGNALNNERADVVYGKDWSETSKDNELYEETLSLVGLEHGDSKEYENSNWNSHQHELNSEFSSYHDASDIDCYTEEEEVEHQIHNESHLEHHDYAQHSNHDYQSDHSENADSTTAIGSDMESEIATIKMFAVGRSPKRSPAPSFVDRIFGGPSSDGGANVQVKSVPKPSPMKPTYNPRRIKAQQGHFSSNLKLKYGTYSVTGKREYQEDRFFNLISRVEKDDSVIHFGYFGIFDGHGGDVVSTEVSQKFHETLLRNSNFPQNCDLSIRQTCDELDNAILSKQLVGGSTAIVAVVLQDELYIANVGDCEGVISQNGIAKSLTPHKHHASDPMEKKRISAAGGQVNKNGRIYGMLEVSRAFGDIDLKTSRGEFRSSYTGDIVIVEPYTDKVILSDDVEFLVLGCDGLFDELSYQSIVDHVKRDLTLGRDLTMICESLAEKAINAGSRDNITVTLLCFHTE